MKCAIIILILCKIAFAEDATLERCVSPPIVRTKLGTLRGVTDRTLFGRRFYSFKGIRYAEPPVGELRFKPPVPVKSWEGVYDATKDGPACPQPLLRPVSEDCLFLNVHTPKLPRRGRDPKYPVIVYIHPGSLTTLTGNSAAAGGQYLMDKNVVLVTCNYRLASLGMLSTGDELAPGNNALKDQVEVMRWVKQHIDAFGGDPDTVLLAGYSAGGVSVSLHLVSPMSRGLFHKAMIMSGCAYGNYIHHTNLFDLAQKQARLVGCPDDTSANIIKCLRTIPAEALGDTLESFRIFGNDPQFIWQPVVESDFGQERFLVESPLISVQCGRIADVPVVTGVTADELIFLAEPVVSNATWLEVLNGDWNKIAPISFYFDPDAPNANENSAELKDFYFNGQPVNSGSLIPLGEIYSDSLSGFGVNRGAKVFSKFFSNSVYYYAFTYKGRFSNFNPPGGNNKYVVHFDDMLYSFWNSLQFPRFNRNDPEAKIVKKWTTLWYNFAKYSKPTIGHTAELDGVDWKPFTNERKEYLDIGNQLQMKTDLYSKRYTKWDELFPLPPPQCDVV